MIVNILSTSTSTSTFIKSIKSRKTSHQMVFHWRLNEAANAEDYIIYVAVLNEEEVIIKQIGNELVVA